MNTPDILIIGGGVAGLTLAADLAPSARVLVLEAETAFGYHASGRSAALYEPAYGAPAVRALTEASFDAYQAGGWLSPRGLMLLGLEGEAEAFQADVAGMNLEELSLTEARGIVPILSREVAFAAYCDRPQDIDTDLLMQDALKRLRQQGGALRTGLRVTAIRREGALWQVTAGDEVFTAPLLVNAAGAWVNEIAAMAGVSGPRFQPFRRSVARIAAPGGADLRRWPIFFGIGESWYAKPDAGALIVSPAEETPVDPHDAFSDDMALAEGLDRYQAHVTTGVTRPLATWGGLRTFAPDRVLVIGEDPAAKGFFWQAGQGGYGFQTAPGAARLGADLILGRAPGLAPDLVAALSPARFG
ncbi:NAD(P)/FAD-dependent oxidoreductase [Falsigemmobacter faecalis]|uniref:FAD-binding oxidoreductase n=1 Tax=Falsigemmobacter faecalis TaxID=2488730 RepID=A0A3P3DQP4_9RHOB|nr:FAD-dependent oxidoreductase [Falsigemmobacter faecalis]RRH75852.1 FAD-binding oxidoreductase [Falsigemmobacter faecalis]